MFTLKFLISVKMCQEEDEKDLGYKYSKAQ